MRPKKRSQCPQIRPCPFVGCQYNLSVDVVNAGYTRVKEVVVHDPWWEEDDPQPRDNCLWDHVRNGLSYRKIAPLLGISHKRVADVETSAVAKLRKWGRLRNKGPLRDLRIEFSEGLPVGNLAAVMSDEVDE